MKMRWGYVRRLQGRLIKLLGKHQRKANDFWENIFEKYRETNPILKNYEDYEAFQKSPYSISINKNTSKISIQSKEECQSPADQFADEVFKKTRGSEEEPVVH